MENDSVNRLRWIRLKPGSFGVFSSEIMFAPDKLTLVVGRNEAGKSTLVSALLAAMYGLNFDKRRTKSDFRPFAGDFEPWSGGSFSLELELRWGEYNLLVNRDFREKTLKVYKNGITEISQEYAASKNRDTFGETLTGGLSPSAFLRSFLISQEQASLISDPGDLVGKIQDVVRSSPGDSPTRNALDLLENSLKKVNAPDLSNNPLNIHSVKSRLTNSINDIESRLKELRQKQSETADSVDDLDNKEKQRDSIKERILMIKRGQVETEINELEERIYHARNAEVEQASLKGELFKLEDFKDFPLDSVGRFEKAVGSYYEAREQAREIEESIQIRKQQLTADKEQLSEFSDLEGIEPDHVDELLADLKDWGVIDRRRERHQQSLEKERENLASKGVPARLLETVKQKLSTWPKDVSQKFSELKSNLDQAVEKRNIAETNYSNVDVPKKRFRFRPAFAVVFLFALVAATGAVLGWNFVLNPGLALIIIIGAIVIIISTYVVDDIFFKRKHRKLKNELDATKKEEKRWEKDISSYAESIGVDDFEIIEQTLNDSLRISGEGDEYFTIRGILDETENELKSVSDRLHPYLEAAGIIDPGESPTRGDVDGFISRLQIYRTRAEQQLRIRQVIKTREEDSRKAAGRVSHPWNELKTILEIADVPLGEDVKSAAEEFRNRAEKADRYRELQNKIQTIQGDAEDKKSLIDLEKRLTTLRESLVKYGNVEPETGSLNELRSKLDELSVSLRELEKEIQSDKTRLYKHIEEIPRENRLLESEKKNLKNSLDSVELQEDAVRKSIEVLNEVESEVFSDAANLLNKELGPILEDLSPKWKETRFDNDLKLHSTDNKTGRSLSPDDIERVLSAGARDAIFLGARLALSDFLSGGTVEAPYILDEPFAHLDDERFASGMELLLERSTGGSQVLLLTCHRQRHKDWYNSLDESSRGRLEWIDLDAEGGGE